MKIQIYENFHVSVVLGNGGFQLQDWKGLQYENFIVIKVPSGSWIKRCVVFRKRNNGKKISIVNYFIFPHELFCEYAPVCVCVCV